MSFPVFEVPAGDVLPILFATYDGGTGASVTMTGLAVTDIEIYKDGSVTQRASDAGYTLLDTDGIDFDATTGIHGFSVDTGDNTDADFYTVGSWFTVVVSSVTVDAQTVNFIAAQFRIVAAEDTAGYRKVTVKSGTGTGEISLSSGLVAIQSGIKKAAALTKFQFLMTDSTNHNPATGLTVAGTVSKDGGAFASITDTVTEVSSGTYEVDISATEMNANNVTLRFTATGADDLVVTLRTDP